MSATGIPIIDWFLNLLDQFGYAIVFGATVFENLFVIGSATPGETVVLAAAFVASLGRLYLPLVWLASVVGTVTGSNISYWFGHHMGRAALITLSQRYEHSRVGRLFGITGESIRESEQYFVDHGAKTVLVARFAVGLKNFVPVMAGAFRMSVFWFEFYTVLGAVTYTTLICAIGWFVGSNLDLAVRIATSIGWVALLIVVALVILALLGRRRIRRRRAERMADLIDIVDPGHADPGRGSNEEPGGPPEAAGAGQGGTHDDA